ncbi:serine hydrolase domain-containing protein [Burkholderia ubonensis]|uniref:serine hydrolase domain-containing protein n=1 Tax=Burkholderia ubonensis TaxID=101571 RepID=UPI0009B3BABF|nr:serine hydrolase [Burkholderia ubonensis]
MGFAKAKAGICFALVWVHLLHGVAVAADAPSVTPESILGGTYAKVMCSSVFVSGRNPDSVSQEELGWLPPLKSELDRANNRLRVWAGTASRTAVFRSGLGCTLLDEGPLAGPEKPISPAARQQVEGRTSTEPFVAATISGVQKVLQDWTVENDPTSPRGARATVVVQDGKIVGESYAQGYDRSMPLPGYSMAKGVAAALTGVLVKKNWLSTGKAQLFPEWSGQADLRSRITVDNLLRMTSGLLWQENYENPTSDVFVMLTSTRDTARFALDRPLTPALGAWQRAGETQIAGEREQIAKFAEVIGASPQSSGGQSVVQTVKPGNYWQYSSGSTSVLSAVMRDAVRANGGDPWRFARAELFDKLGMPSAVVEPDAIGTYVFSAFMYATALDWARFGQFLLQGGKWNGEQILPESWLAYMTRRTVVPDALGDISYGAGVWLYSADALGAAVPHDAFYLRGFEGQYLIVVPSRKLVVVRLGNTRPEENFDIRQFMSDLLKQFDSAKTT